MGRPTTASGLLVLPHEGPRRLTTVLHSHGTLSYRDDAPSADGEGLDRVVSSLYASGGRAVVAPDYLGLGKGPGRHPYMHNGSAVSAAVDMLRAARQATARHGRELDGDVFFDSDHTGEEILAKLPGTDPELLTDTWYDQLIRPSGRFHAVLRSVDTTCQWSPQVPVRLYAATGDLDVSIANSRKCVAQLHGRGVQADVIDQGDTDHLGSFRASVPQIAQWFDEPRRPLDP
ncbi:hypothetical protein ACFQ6C_18505 [Streptomyces sp. NPDC056454]|uniref:hypothetical protein n=1 Tax=Streptomyces sp. NPDC056454 TaxID=3345823 RepID=UPI003684318E